MNFRLTLTMVAVFVVLAGAVWYTELRNGPPPPATPTGQASVLNLDSANITKIEVEDQGKRAAVQRGDDNVWRLTEPQPGEADNTTVNSTASQLAKLNATRKLESPGNLGDYGLANPSTKLRLTTKDGGSSEIDVGAKTPDSSAYYVKLAGQDPVYVVSAFTISGVTKWTTDPPKPRPTATPIPASPSPATSPTAAGSPAPTSPPAPSPTGG